MMSGYATYPALTRQATYSIGTDTEGLARTACVATLTQCQGTFSERLRLTKMCCPLVITLRTRLLTPTRRKREHDQRHSVS
jgi:hypothetical protein